MSLLISIYYLEDEVQTCIEKKKSHDLIKSVPPVWAIQHCISRTLIILKRHFDSKDFKTEFPQKNLSSTAVTIHNSFSPAMHIWKNLNKYYNYLPCV